MSVVLEEKWSLEKVEITKLEFNLAFKSNPMIELSFESKKIPLHCNLVMLREYPDVDRWLRINVLKPDIEYCWVILLQNDLDLKSADKNSNNNWSKIAPFFKTWAQKRLLDGT